MANLYTQTDTSLAAHAKSKGTKCNGWYTLFYAKNDALKSCKFLEIQYQYAKIFLFTTPGNTFPMPSGKLQLLLLHAVYAMFFPVYAHLVYINTLSTAESEQQ